MRNLFALFLFAPLASCFRFGGLLFNARYGLQVSRHSPVFTRHHFLRRQSLATDSAVYKFRMFGAGQFDDEFKSCHDPNLSGCMLFDAFKHFANSKYSDELSAIASNLLHEEFKKDILNDERQVITKVEIKDIDSRGFDLEVVICSSSYCWLKMVNAPFPRVCRNADSLLETLHSMSQIALDGKLEPHIPSDYDLLPEFLASAVNLMNGEFVEYLKETVNKLGGSDENAAEHIKSVMVTNLDGEGFDCEADICRQHDCHRLTFRVQFPRRARNARDLQAEIVECLEEGACRIDWTSVH